MEENNSITFDFIYECWKNKNYPDGFDGLLKKYLDGKADIFSGANVNGITSWLNKILVAIEIGIGRDPVAFGEYKNYWRGVLGREWKVSVEDRWVEWA